MGHLTSTGMVRRKSHQWQLSFACVCVVWCVYMYHVPTLPSCMIVTCLTLKLALVGSEPECWLYSSFMRFKWDFRCPPHYWWLSRRLCGYLLGSRRLFGTGTTFSRVVSGTSTPVSVIQRVWLLLLFVFLRKILATDLDCPIISYDNSSGGKCRQDNWNLVN